MIPAYWKTTLKTLRTFGMNDHIFSLQSLIHSHPFSNIYIEIMAVHQIHHRLFKTFKKVTNKHSFIKPFTPAYQWPSHDQYYCIILIM